MSLERLKILRAALSLNSFTIRELAAYAGAKEATVRTTLQREASRPDGPRIEQSDVYEPTRGRPRVVWSVANPDSIEAELSEFSDRLAPIIDFGASDGSPMSPPDSVPAPPADAGSSVGPDVSDELDVTPEVLAWLESLLTGAHPGSVNGRRHQPVSTDIVRPSKAKKPPVVGRTERDRLRALALERVPGEEHLAAMAVSSAILKVGNLHGSGQHRRRRQLEALVRSEVDALARSRRTRIDRERGVGHGSPAGPPRPGDPPLSDSLWQLIAQVGQVEGLGLRTQDVEVLELLISGYQPSEAQATLGMTEGELDSSRSIWEEALTRARDQV